MSTTTQGLLAIDGGEKVRTAPLPVRKLIGEREKSAVVELLDRVINDGSHLLAYQGEQETAYCREFAGMLGGGFADCVNSGSSAMFVAMAALELEPLSEVIVPPISDPGGVMPVGLLGCIPIAADSDPGSFNTSAEQIEKVYGERWREA
jgi:perosamine synthetase